jgi:hypothetical protein
MPEMNFKCFDLLVCTSFHQLTIYPANSRKAERPKILFPHFRKVRSIESFEKLKSASETIGQSQVL